MHLPEKSPGQTGIAQGNPGNLPELHALKMDPGVSSGCLPFDHHRILIVHTLKLKFGDPGIGAIGRG